jgi:aldehyde dehydrogenase (NAD+)
MTAGQPGAVPDTAGDRPLTSRLFIGGEWVDSVTGGTFESRDPSDWRNVVGRFQAGNAADTAMAVRAAEEALPAWRAVPAPRRGDILDRFAALLVEHQERMARVVSREIGVVLREALADVQEGVDVARLMAGEGRSLRETGPSELRAPWETSVRQPLGVAGIITPWSAPVGVPCRAMLSALVAGNTVVFKPSSDSPACAALLAELLAEAGFPPGTVNLVTGSGPDVGDAIVESRDVQVIAFAGHASLGRAIAVKTGRHLKRLSLQLGGKNAVAVLPDADLDLAVAAILWSAFGRTGQHCTACSRVVVDRRVLGPLLERLEAGSRALRLGPGLDAATDVGPLISERALATVAEYVEVGRTEGELVCGGRQSTESALRNGWFFEPTIFTDVRPMARIAQDEIYGPVLAVIPVDGYDEVVRAVNGVRYGRASSIFTRDLDTARRAMRDFETGLVRVNAGTTGTEARLPFSGWKASGNGRAESGPAALDAFTEWKAISVDGARGSRRTRIDDLPG